MAKLDEKAIEELVREVLEEKKVNVVYPNGKFFNEKSIKDILLLINPSL